MTSACFTFSIMSLTSSFNTQLPLLIQDKHPIQYSMLFPFNDTYSTSCPASNAPLTHFLAKISELLFVLRLVYIIKTFIDIQSSWY